MKVSGLCNHGTHTVCYGWVGKGRTASTKKPCQCWCHEVVKATITNLTVTQSLQSAARS